MNWAEAEAAYALAVSRLMHGDQLSPTRDVKEIVDGALGDDALYRKVWKLKAKCWHTGSYASHDQGCHEQRYEQIWPKEDVDE